MQTKLVTKKNTVRKKIGYEQKIGYEKKLGTKKKISTTNKLGTKNVWDGKKLGVRGRSTPGELDPQSHILGPFRQTSDKYLEGNSMITHLWRTIWVESQQDLVGNKRNVL